MNEFQLFRTRMQKEACCRVKYETSFITDGAAPIQIHILRLDEDRDATMVFTDAEGPDSALVFTPKQLDVENNLQKGDYYIWDKKMFFVYEDVIIARKINYLKQKAYQCNAIVEPLGCEAECGGYFISSLRSYVDTEFQQKINVSDKERPILVVPKHGWIKIGAIISVGGKPWKVIDFDSITNPGIVYISLERDFYKKGSDVSDESEDCLCLRAGIEHSVSTQDGYFNSSSPLQIKSRTATKVVFEIPFGIENVTIATKNYNGVIQENEYKVVM